MISYPLALDYFNEANSQRIVTDECRCPACVADKPRVPTTGVRNPNTEHGHVRPRPDGVRARCGGPGLCSECSREQAAFIPSPSIVPDMVADRYPADYTPTHLPDLPRTVIAFTGLAGSGKSTVAEHLTRHHGFTRVRFAGPLKEMMRALGLTEAEIEGDRKEVPCELLGGRTPRYAMQTIGTEWGRNIIARDLWIRAWRAAVDKLPAGASVVVDDCRFPNEADAVRALGGVLVRIVRPGAGAGAAGHISEGQELGAVVATLHNTFTPQMLCDQADALVRDLSWAHPAR